MIGTLWRISRSERDLALNLEYGLLDSAKSTLAVAVSSPSAALWRVGICAICLSIWPSKGAAQIGRLPGSSASEPPSESAFAINPEAWNSFKSFDVRRIFGRAEDQEVIVATRFESEHVVEGRKIGQQTLIPSLSMIGPLFGGEGYGDLEVVAPLDPDPYSAQLRVKGGWKYRLTKYIDVDLGGDFDFYERRVTGPGILAENGARFLGPLYAGVLGHFFLSPSVYFMHESDLRQTSVVAGVDQDFDVSSMTNVPGLTVNLRANVGWVDADDWEGTGPGADARNLEVEYVYWNAGVELRRRIESVDFGAGVRYAGNDDTDRRDLGGINLGPNQMLWIGGSVRYRF